jgi:branched-chain amino acid transport system substrate-binding protein
MDAIKIGWLGSALDGPGGGYDKIHQMAFDEATEKGLLDRPVELVLHPENGLPQGSAKNATDGFRWLVDQGCIGVAGAYSSDNAITVGPLANDIHVPLISWCGTEQFHGDYCFRLGNGDCGGDATLMVGWLKRNGYERVAVLSEISPNGEEYFRYFRQATWRGGCCGRDRVPDTRRFDRQPS